MDDGLRPQIVITPRQTHFIRFCNEKCVESGYLTKNELGHNRIKYKDILWRHCRVDILYNVYDNVKFRLKSWRNKKIHLCDVLAAGLIDFNQRSRQLSIHGKRNHHFMKYFNINNKYFP